MLQRLAVRAVRGRPGLAVPARGCSETAGLQRRTFLRPRAQGSSRRAANDTLNVERMARERRDYDRTRLIFLASGAVAGLVAMGCTAWRIKTLLEQNPTKLDAAGPPGASDLGSRKVVVHDKDGREIVPTGNSTIPAFPRTIDLPAALADGDGSPSTEYTLVGLGTRTVTFLRFEVYVVGFYVATADIAALQHRLVKKVNPIATALVSGEKSELRASLVDPAESQALWDALLSEGIPARSLFRIVPVRDTDFPHLRDGFVRAIKAQAERILGGKETETEAEAPAPAAPTPEFGESIREFRQIFNRGKAHKGRELLVVRGADGTLSVVFDDGRPSGRQLLGSVGDERVSRSLWMNYLAGPSVASEAARQSVADGLVEFVERPIGTVAAQVV